MKKLALLFALAMTAGAVYAQDAKTPATTKAPETMAAPAKTHEVNAEVVSVDAAAKTITVKGEKDNKTVPVDDKALASVKDLKAGQKVTLLCRDNEKGEHVAVAGVKTAAPEQK
jgi:ribosomal protein S1